MRESCQCCKQYPGQAGVARQDRIDKANKGKFEAWLRAGMPEKFKWRKSQDVPKFLKKFDAVQKRTAKSSLQLP